MLNDLWCFFFSPEIQFQRSAFSGSDKLLISAERIKSGENTILNHRSVCQRAISISLSALNYSRLQSLSAGFALAVKIIPISRDSKHDRSLLSLMISRDSKHDR